MRRDRWTWLASSLLLVVLAGCGQADPADADGPTGSLRGTYVGQEVWIVYASPEHEKIHRIRLGRSREDALALAREVHLRALQGEDLGELACRHSNAPGGGAEGFSGVLPRDAERPDARDRALAAADVGQVTGIVEWMGGFWFAKRVTLEDGHELQELFEARPEHRVKLRSIWIPYQGCYLFRKDFEPKLSQFDAEALAHDLLRRLRGGEDFAELAQLYSRDQSGEQGGVVRVPTADRRGTTEWIEVGNRGVPGSVLCVAFRASEVGLHPAVIESPYGYFLLEIIERNWQGPRGR